MVNTFRRTALPYFATANQAYANARLRIYEVDETTNESNGVLATLYVGATGAVEAPNPYTLSAYGMFESPLYAETGVIMVIDNAQVPDHETGIILPSNLAELTAEIEDSIAAAVADVEDMLDAAVATATADAQAAATESQGHATDADASADAAAASALAAAVFSSATITDSGTTVAITAATHKGKYLRCTSGSAVTLTLPSDATDPSMSTDSEGFVVQAGAGVLTVVADVGVTINSATGLVVAAQKGGFFWKKVDSNTYDLHGYMSIA